MGHSLISRRSETLVPDSEAVSAFQETSFGAAILEQLGRVGMAFHLRPMQRRVSILAPGVDVGTSQEQQVGCIQQADVGGLDERRPTLFVFGFNICALPGNYDCGQNGAQLKRRS